MVTAKPSAPVANSSTMRPSATPVGLITRNGRSGLNFIGMETSPVTSSPSTSSMVSEHASPEIRFISASPGSIAAMPPVMSECWDSSIRESTEDEVPEYPKLCIRRRSERAAFIAWL